MMTKEVFTENVKKAIEMKMDGVTVAVKTVTKNNELELTGLVINKPGDVVAPTVYVEDFYESYENGRDFDEIVDKIIDLSRKEVPSEFRNAADNFTDANYVKENVIAVVCNAARNEQLLSEIPHILKEDLAIYFKVKMDIGGSASDGIGSITIRNEHLPIIGLTIEELYEAAKANIKKSAIVKTMEDVMKEMMAKDGMPEEMISLMFGMPPEQQMYIVGNDNSIFGAVNMFDTDLLDTVVETVNSNLYILPSSIHEVIAVSENLGTPDSLAAMVREVNGTQVALEEQLSDNVYYYNTETKEVSLVS